MNQLNNIMQEKLVIIRLKIKEIILRIILIEPKMIKMKIIL